MTDIVIIKGRDGKASVYSETRKGKLFLNKHMRPPRSDIQLTVPNELADELVNDLKEIEEDIQVEVR